MVKFFSLEKVQKGGAVWNIDKLKWFNKHYMKLLAPENVGKEVLARFPDALREKEKANSRIFEKIIPVILDHISVFGDVRAFAEAGEYDYFFEDPTYSRESLLWKDENDPSVAAQKLQKVLALIDNIDDAFFVPETIKTAIWNYATEAGRGSVLWPMRYALSGRDKSPDPFTLAGILGKETTIHRIITAIKLLQE